MPACWRAALVAAAQMCVLLSLCFAWKDQETSRLFNRSDLRKHDRRNTNWAEEFDDGLGLEVQTGSLDVSSKSRTGTLPFAWATLLSGQSENMTSLALLQLASVHRFSSYRHVTMVTPDVDEHSRALLHAAGSIVAEVALIEPPAASLVPPWWAAVFTKLQVFSLSDYRAVAFLDLDAYLATRRADEIFDSCDDSFELCALRESFDLCRDAQGSFECEQGAPGSMPMLSAGIMVAHPGLGTLARLRAWVDAADAVLGGSPTERLLASAEYPLGSRERFAMYPEQEILTAMYLRRSASSFDFLAPHFGECEGSLRARARDEPSRVIIHDCSLPKYMQLPLCSWFADGALDTPAACNKSSVQLFQQLLVQSNPCVQPIVGQQPAQCKASNAGQPCAWCGDGVGCHPEATCHPADTPAKLAQTARIQSLANMTASTRRRHLQYYSGSGGSGSHSHDPHSHYPHGHDPHSHGPHSHDPHSHDPHSHDPHGHGPHNHDPHGHSPHSHDPHSHSTPPPPSPPPAPPCLDCVCDLTFGADPCATGSHGPPTASNAAQNVWASLVMAFTSIPAVQSPSSVGDTCPTQGGHPRCAPTALYASSCVNGYDHSFELRVNLGTSATLAGRNVIGVEGYYPAASFQCFMPDGSEVTLGPWALPGSVSPPSEYTLTECAGAHAFILTGGGYCGASYFLNQEGGTATEIYIDRGCTPTPSAMCAGPSEQCYLDERCLNVATDPLGGVGCGAGGHQLCRFCGFGPFDSCERPPPSPPPPPPPCQDLYADCPTWAADGSCGGHSWFEANCPFSCCGCNSPCSDPPISPPWTPPPSLPAPPYSPPPPPPPVLAATSSGSHKCASMGGGPLYCWGYNWNGQVGDGTTSNTRSAPTEVSGLDGAVSQLALGSSHSCALLAGGTLKCCA